MGYPCPPMVFRRPSKQAKAIGAVRPFQTCRHRSRCLRRHELRWSDRRRHWRSSPLKPPRSGPSPHPPLREVWRRSPPSEVVDASVVGFLGEKAMATSYARKESFGREFAGGGRRRMAINGEKVWPRSSLYVFALRFALLRRDAVLFLPHVKEVLRRFPTWPTFKCCLFVFRARERKTPFCHSISTTVRLRHTEV